VALLVGLAACGGSTSATTSSGPQIFIQGVSRFAADPFVITEGCAEAAEAKKLGVKYSFDASPTLDAATEITHWDADLLKSPDGIVLGPPSAAPFTGPVQQASAKGIPVAVMNTALAARTGYKIFNPDWSNLGTVVAPLVQKAIGDSGKMAIVADGPENPDDMIRWQAVFVGVHIAFPGIKILPTQYAHITAATAAQITQQLVVSNPDLGLIFATNGPEANGIEAALTESHNADKVKVIVIDASPATQNNIRNGSVFAAVAQRPWVMGTKAVDAVVEYARAHRDHAAVQPGTPYLNPVPLTLVTKSNVDSLTLETGKYVSSCPS
jgi:ribose transport system substrate-binding protein